MRFKNLFFLLILFTAGSLFAQQQVKVIEIIDTNLFLLEDGRKISLANLEMPSKNDTSQVMQVLVKDILRFEKQMILKKRLLMEKSPAAPLPNDVIPVHLFLKHLFEKLNLNKELLKIGYARYAPIDSLYAQEYLWAVQKAQRQKRGIWNPVEYALSKQVDFFAGVNGGMGNFKTDDFNEHNEIHFLEAQLMAGNPRGLEHAEFKLGQMRIREKGFNACEYGPARYSEVDAIYRYAIITTYINHRYIGFGIGGIFIDQTKRGFCDERLLTMFGPTFNLRLGKLDKYFIAADIFNSIFNYWTVKMVYRFNRPYSRIWIGYLGNSYRKSYHDTVGPNDYIGLGAQYYFKRFLFKVSGQIVPYTNEKTFTLGLNFLFAGFSVK